MHERRCTQNDKTTNKESNQKNTEIRKKPEVVNNNMFSVLMETSQKTKQKLNLKTKRKRKQRIK